MNLTGQLLIAMPNLADPVFSKTVTLICSHNQDGAMGLVLNRPADFNIADLFSRIQLDAPQTYYQEKSVFSGGPVQPERGFVLHQFAREFDSSLMINKNLSLTTSKDILEYIADESSDLQDLPVLIALGYAGWNSGQIEQEMAQNAWLNISLDEDSLCAFVFEQPYHSKFTYAMGLMGLTYANLAETAGHA